MIQICSNLVINYKLEICFNDVSVLLAILFYFQCLYYLVLLLLHCAIKNSMLTDRLLQLMCHKLFENINFLQDKIFLISDKITSCPSSRYLNQGCYQWNFFVLPRYCDCSLLMLSIILSTGLTIGTFIIYTVCIYTVMAKNIA